MSAELSLDGRRLRLSNLDRLLWPQAGLTKAHLIAYVAKASSFVLPFLRGRPLALRRYPEGIEGTSFVQKACPSHAPDWIARVTSESGSGRAISYILCNDRPTLVWLANLGAIELHPWHARSEALAAPDWVVFDLDPVPPHGYAAAAQVALALKHRLDEMGLGACVKTSGGRGLHVYVPLARHEHTHRQARLFARLVAQLLQEQHPRQISLERRPAARQGRVYIDVDQNGQGKTLAAALLPRGRPGAPLSMPLAWEQVDRTRPERYDMSLSEAALAQGMEAFRGVLTEGCRLAAVLRTLRSQEASEGPYR